MYEWVVRCKTCGWESETFPDTPLGYAAAISRQKEHLDATREIKTKKGVPIPIEIREHLVSPIRRRKEM